MGLLGGLGANAGETPSLCLAHSKQSNKQKKIMVLIHVVVIVSENLDVMSKMGTANTGSAFFKDTSACHPYKPGPPARSPLIAELPSLREPRAEGRGQSDPPWESPSAR